MNTQNKTIENAIGRALACAVELDGMGCSVLEITARGDRPLVRIDSPHGAFQGALHKMWRDGDQRVKQMVQFRAGAKVEWIERQALPAGAVA